MKEVAAFFRKEVLILLLMEYGHGDGELTMARKEIKLVLILLLMEYGHGERIFYPRKIVHSAVLILLLMEYGHGEYSRVLGKRLYLGS